MSHTTWHHVRLASKAAEHTKQVVWAHGPAILVGGAQECAQVVRRQPVGLPCHSQVSSVGGDQCRLYACNCGIVNTKVGVGGRVMLVSSRPRGFGCTDLQCWLHSWGGVLGERSVCCRRLLVGGIRHCVTRSRSRSLCDAGMCGDCSRRFPGCWRVSSPNWRLSRGWRSFRSSCWSSRRSNCCSSCWSR